MEGLRERLAVEYESFLDDGRRIDWRDQRVPPGALHRAILIGALTIVIGICILLAYPLSQSFQRLADLVDTLQH